MKDRIESLRKEAGDILRHNILPFWEKMRDPQGGFYGEAGPDGTINPGAERGCVLGSRILWAFSAAGKALDSKHLLEHAAWAASYFTGHFIDREYGGVFWTLTADGRPSDTKKQLYAQAFAIYALSEYYLATGSHDALDAAMLIFGTVEARFRDRLNGGYSEALSRDLSPISDMSLSESDINAPKTMNSHLHLLEAYATLYSASHDPEVKEATIKLLHLLKDRITGPDGHLYLYFKDDWTVIPAKISCGHDIEASWLAMECALRLEDGNILGDIRNLSLILASAGNGIIGPEGPDPTEEWWVYAESVVGNLWLSRFHGRKEGDANALLVWEFIKEKLIDREHGEWYRALLEDGSPDIYSVKAGLWKCPYHNTRMCLQVMSLTTQGPASSDRNP